MSNNLKMLLFMTIIILLISVVPLNNTSLTQLNSVYAFEPAPPTNNSRVSANISSMDTTIDTDKSSYGFGDYVVISGTVKNPEESKKVRIDIYDPESRIFISYANTSEIRQSNIQVTPDINGLYAYSFLLNRVVPSQEIKGNYKIEATYKGNTTEAKFLVK